MPPKRLFALLAAPAVIAAAILPAASASAAPVLAPRGVTTTVVDAPEDAPIDIDNRTESRTFAVDAPGVVGDVRVVVDFQKSGDTCEAVRNWSFPDEIQLVLLSPEGTSVELVSDGTYREDHERPSPGTATLTCG